MRVKITMDSTADAPKEFLESYGIKESGLERVTKAAFKLLGL